MQAEAGLCTQRWPLGPNNSKGKSSENKQIFPSTANYCIWLINISYLFAGLRSAISPLPDNRFNPSLNHDLHVSHLLTAANFFPPVTTPLWNPFPRSLLSFCYLIPNPSPDDHNRSTNWFPISPLHLFFLSLTRSGALRVVPLVRRGSEASSASPPINYPASRRYILNVTFLAFSHASRLPPNDFPITLLREFPGWGCIMDEIDLLSN